MFTDKQKRYLIRCIEKNIEILDTEASKDVIAELEGIKEIVKQDSSILHFTTGQAEFDEVEDCLKQLEEITKLYSSMLDIHVVQEYDKIKKAVTPLLEYLATLKDTINNDASFNEEILKKEIKVDVTNALVEEKGISLTQAEKMATADKRYKEEFRRLRPYLHYANVTKTKYDFYSKVLASVTQSVSTASKEAVNSRMVGGYSS